jgi:hypothetical protein
MRTVGVIERRRDRVGRRREDLEVGGMAGSFQIWVYRSAINPIMNNE